MSILPPVSDRHIIVSGGSRGLGKAIVTGLLDAGYRVSTFSRKSSDFIRRMEENGRFYLKDWSLIRDTTLQW